MDSASPARLRPFRFWEPTEDSYIYGLRLGSLEREFDVKSAPIAVKDRVVTLSLGFHVGGRANLLLVSPEPNGSQSLVTL